MSAINSIYIPQIESKFDAEFIAGVFERNGIAQVGKIYIEPYKSNMKNGLDIGLKTEYIINNYNNVYIEIKSWYKSETADNFIEYLKNPLKEARIMYGYNNWWKVYINNYPDKFLARERVLTIFKDNNINHEEWDIVPVTDQYIDSKKTKSKKIHSIENIIYNEYDLDLKASIYGYQNVDEMFREETFDGYLHEIAKKQNLLVNKYL